MAALALALGIAAVLALSRVLKDAPPEADLVAGAPLGVAGVDGDPLLRALCVAAPAGVREGGMLRESAELRVTVADALGAVDSVAAAGDGVAVLDPEPDSH
jgi:hypothetical protein